MTSLVRDASTEGATSLVGGASPVRAFSVELGVSTTAGGGGTEGTDFVRGEAMGACLFSKPDVSTPLIRSYRIA